MKLLLYGRKVAAEKIRHAVAQTSFEIVEPDSLNEVVDILQDGDCVLLVDISAQGGNEVCRSAAKFRDTALLVSVLNNGKTDWEKAAKINADGFIHLNMGQDEIGARLEAIVRCRQRMNNVLNRETINA